MLLRSLDHSLDELESAHNQNHWRYQGLFSFIHKQPFAFIISYAAPETAFIQAGSSMLTKSMRFVVFSALLFCYFIIPWIVFPYSVKNVVSKYRMWAKVNTNRWGLLWKSTTTWDKCPLRKHTSLCRFCHISFEAVSVMLGGQLQSFQARF